MLRKRLCCIDPHTACRSAHSNYVLRFNELFSDTPLFVASGPCSIRQILSDLNLPQMEGRCDHRCGNHGSIDADTLEEVPEDLGLFIA